MPSFKFNNALTGSFILGIRVSRMDLFSSFGNGSHFHECARGLSSFL